MLAVALLGAICPAAAGASASCGVGAGSGGLYGSGSGLLAQINSLAGSGAPPVGAPGPASGPGQAQACAPAEPASAPVDAPSTLAGNPVELTTGVKLERVIDADLGGARPALADDAAGLVVSRFYSSASTGSAALGPGWRLGLDVRLHLGAPVPGGGVRLQIVQGDGRVVSFGGARRGPHGVMRRAARRHEDGVLDLVGDQGLPWVWRWRSGRRLWFDEAGRLRRVEPVAAPGLRLGYDQHGRLASVLATNGRRVLLRYQDETGVRVHAGAGAGAGANSRLRVPEHPSRRVHGHPPAPVGRLLELGTGDGALVRYRYDAAGRLVSVRHADGRQVRYHYDGPRSGRLVSIQGPDGRASQYRYDRHGRVSLSRAAGDPPGQALSFEYVDDPQSTHAGQTVVRVAGKFRARYRWADFGPQAGNRLLDGSGPGCARCPPTGIRYRYDPAGRLREARPMLAGRIEARRWLTVRRDRRGRPLALDWQLGGRRASLRVTWSARTPRSQAHALDKVVELSWPSRAPGRRVVARVVRDTSGRVARFEQTGYSAAINVGAGGRVQVDAIAVRRSGPELAGFFMPGLAAAAAPWPVQGRRTARLLRWRDDFGRLVAWWSPDSGLVRRGFDSHDRLRREQRADGAIAEYRYDDAGRLSSQQVFAVGAVRTAADATPQHRVRLHWSNGAIAAIDEAAHRERFVRGPGARLRSHQVALRVAGGQWHWYRSDYRHDEAGRLLAWTLPGGGTVHIRRDLAGQVVGLDLQQPGESSRQPLVGMLARGPRGLTRIAFGNRVFATLESGAREGAVAQGRGETEGRGAEPGGRRMSILHRVDPLAGARAEAEAGAEAEAEAEAGAGAEAKAETSAARQGLVLDHRLVFHETGGLRQWRRGGEVRDYVYDQNQRLVRARHRGAQTDARWTFGYDQHGNRVSGRRPGRDAAGRLVRDGDRSYRWDGRGHLVEVARAGRVVARYQYNHRSQRIGKLVDGRKTSYLYDLRRRLLAEIDERGIVQRQYVYLGELPVAVLDRAEEHAGARFRVRYLHLNHLGAPEAVTDEQARIVWRADYAPFGRRLTTSDASADVRDRGARGFSLALRLPGQFEDVETGLHYNDHRYYDPDTGRYLSPDPLGAAGETNPYVYAGNDPLTRVDPTGLLLFAFDGTDNGDPPSRQDDWSNVYKFAQSYADGRVWYMAGVGRDDSASGIQTNAFDVLNANTARMRVDYLVNELEQFVGAGGAPGTTLNVDVIGFSRGAAMARDFSNRVADRIRDGSYLAVGACVRLRFIGLWDTVAQFGGAGLSNAGWRLSIPGEAAYAAHAVALNEHRTLFPVESIAGSALAGVRIERGFVGAHADIGGSYAEGDLSDVALIWMRQQAMLAGVRMFALTSEFERVTAPLLHDPSGGNGDREVRYRNDWGWTYANPLQRVAQIDGMQWSETGQFIRRYPQPLPDVYGEPIIAGEVDFSGYGDWLGLNYDLVLASPA